jgi:hypothetical protein
MNKSSKNIFSIVLAFLVFISSNGIVLSAHRCLSNQKTEISFFHKKCCGKENKSCHSSPSGNSLSKKCCELKITYHKVDVKTPLVKNVPVFNPYLFSNAFPLSSSDFSDHYTSGLEFNKEPPVTLRGISFLYSVHTLRI